MVISLPNQYYSSEIETDSKIIMFNTIKINCVKIYLKKNVIIFSWRGEEGWMLRDGNVQIDP